MENRYEVININYLAFDRNDAWRVKKRAFSMFIKCIHVFQSL